MKSILRRTAVLLLVLAMVLSMLPAVFAATGSKIYNNGTRDQACTALSSQAKAYYTGNYTYEKLSALSGATQTESSYDATQNNPLYDALYDMLGAETYQKYLERGNIEVAPLAYMRGRTLDDSFIILDEAQNTTREQMKMFLTRLGFGSKIVITGDITQIDLPSDKTSGLKDAVRILENIPDIAICRLTASDVVRHALVQKIIAAYESGEKKQLPAQKKLYRKK